ncbi:MAG: sugar phosphate isomerase/epimerase [Fusobacteriaceae bacterium]|jgi:sugar phosphate isomerase/epimerase|nr:sugar phosphate isomerase/epimerase [Fusobacteriaceae bacterium]
MKLGLNLSFAVKRWMKPEVLAAMCREIFDVNYVQFTWDLIDPWWPGDVRDEFAGQYARAFEKRGIEIGATFGGLASYSYPQLLAPDPKMRDVSETFFKRAIDLTRAMGVKAVGTPIGGMDYADARDPETRAALYREALERIRRLAEYGRQKGLDHMEIEVTPLITEFPHSPETSIRLMKDLEGSAIPVKLLIDWGHALFKPLLKEEADISLWFKTCKDYIAAIHLQQTDGQWDRHWDFTNPDGTLTPEYIVEKTKEAGLENIVSYLEVVTIFEDDDDHVLDGMKKSMELLRRACAS